MDEFADLEKELSGNGFRRGFHQLEDFVFEIEERRSQSNTIFWREEIDLSPKIKRNRTATPRFQIFCLQGCLA